MSALEKYYLGVRAVVYHPECFFQLEINTSATRRDSGVITSASTPCTLKLGAYSTHQKRHPITLTLSVCEPITLVLVLLVQSVFSTPVLCI
jgi:hypothetical protein